MKCGNRELRPWTFPFPPLPRSLVPWHWFDFPRPANIRACSCLERADIQVIREMYMMGFKEHTVPRIPLFMFRGLAYQWKENNEGFKRTQFFKSSSKTKIGVKGNREIDPFVLKGVT